MIPRIPRSVSGLSAVCAALTVPYYALHGDGTSTTAMVLLVILNAACARGWF
jgi:hypothetical protein